MAPHYAGAYPQFYKAGVNWLCLPGTGGARRQRMGHTRFDFGRSNADRRVFKRGWGCIIASSYHAAGSRSCGSESDSHEFKVQGRDSAWQHLPPQLTKAIGPLIVRNLPWKRSSSNSSAGPFVTQQRSAHRGRTTRCAWR